MRSHEIFQRMSPALAAQIFTFLQAEQKPVYKAAIQGLANQRNLRGVFIERNRRPSDFRGCRLRLAAQVSDSLASHLLQAWLLGANKQMLCDFLAALEIKHEEDGTVEELPSAPPKEKIASSGCAAAGEVSSGNSGRLSARLPRHGQRGAMACPRRDTGGRAAAETVSRRPGQIEPRYPPTPEATSRQVTRIKRIRSSEIRVIRVIRGQDSAKCSSASWTPAP